ncbi:DUF1372 family protein [Streptococcus suis]|uniref:DUF1372 family protein n=1 Tax=Streptococcus suis TaxID=1307 RepID=UPI0005CDCCD5|nr:DUF1372 family protein [Streptococcus suis]MCB2854205.1 DUF1372 family protein [Streptococcus suis]MCB2893272.1 DUF1372 family protein [Streptococcus suis]MCB2917486.1 DUF1372 family protein [Streptococcus suis]MCB2923929.1 DUF1372 family protein [Streptococcus suis]MCL4936507.1 DUF1372 family protein [Streptococcus suis]
MKKYLSAIANFYILFSILATPLIVVYKVDELSQKLKQPIIIYQVDNADTEMFGKVTAKDVVDGHYYVEVKPYGKFLVTREQYEAIKFERTGEISIGMD